jgi:hypothetical protein
LKKKSHCNSRPLAAVTAVTLYGFSRLGAKLKRTFKHGTPRKVSAIVLFSLLPALLLSQNTTPEIPTPPAAVDTDRILGVIPNYQTVTDPHKAATPLTVKQKFELFAKETIDPFTAGAAVAGAALSQADNDAPRYGHGSGPYAERFGAAVADITTQNFFSDAVLASFLHEDPRYFRLGAEYHFWHRLGYSLSRVAITRTDAGKDRFNYSGIVGMSMGIALSNAYYPASSVNGTEVASRFGTSLVSSALSNILPEFWPDIRQKLRRKPKP